MRVRRFDKITILEGDVVLREVDDLDQSQTLLWSVKAQAQAVGREGERYRVLYGTFTRVSEVELREALGFGLESGQDIVERGAED